MLADESRCPVCRARFRGSVACARCGADLAPLMRLARDAWRARNEARRAVVAADLERAHECALAAQRLAATSVGARLLSLIQWMRRVTPTEGARAP